MIKRVLSKLRKVTMSLFAVLCAGAVWAEEGEVTYVTSPMQDPTAGYIRTGLGKKGNEVAVVFTNHTKTATWTVPANLYNVEFLVVGGGGGGGADNNDDVRMAGSGGGGGGVVTGLVNFVEGSIVSATVGIGGEGGKVEKKPGTSSNNYWGAAKLAGASTFGVGSDVYVTANAGGRDLGATATSFTSGNNGGSGGSGAGGRQKKNGGAATKGSGDNNFVVFYEAFGNNGGKGSTKDWYSGSANSAGGGGGAHPDVSLGAGGDAGWTEEGGWFGGKGGEGLTSNITGFDVVYGSGGGGGNATGLGGVAGEGAGDGNTANISGMGAAYGRGNDALQNQGGGGGGGGRGNGPGYQKRGGGNGGSGIVVFRYSVYEAAVVTAEGSTLYATFAEAFDAAQAGETVKLLNDVTLAEKITVKKAVTLDLNGCTLSETVTDSYGAIYIGTAGNLTITDSATGGKIATDGGIVIGNYGTVTVAGGTIEAGVVAEEDASVYNFYYNGSTYGKLTVTGGKVGRIWNCGNANITAGEVVDIDNSGAMTIAEAATVSGTVIIKNGSDAAEVPGAGTLTAPESLTVQVGNDGAEAVYVDGKWLVQVFAATIGEAKFASFDAAIAAAQAGDTVKLYQDVKLSEILVINKAITLDGNGCTLTSTAARAINVSGVDGVTIKNLTISTSGERAINVIQGATNVTIENVTATAYNYTVNIASSAANAVVAINNSTLNGLCTVNVAAAGAKVTIDGSTVNCNDNNTTAGESYAALCLGKEAVGASIVATNTVVNVTEGSDSVKARNGAENGTITIDGSTDNVTEVVAVISYAGQNSYHSFFTLEDAIDWATDADTIKILKDIATDVAFTVAKKVTIDLNGKTIATTQADTEGNGVFWVKAGGELTLNGEGTVNGVGGNAYNIAIWADGGKVIINGGTYTNEGAQDDGPDGAHFDLIYVKNGGAVEINGGTFRCQTPEWTLNSHDTKKGTIVVNGGLFYQFNPSDCATEGAGTNWCAEGLKGAESAENAGYYEIVDAWTAPMPGIDDGDTFNIEYTDAVIEALQGAEGVVGVKVNNVVLKGDEAVKALNDAVACFEEAITIDGTTASLDIEIKVTEVNTENPAASTVVVTRNGVPLTVKATPTVKYFYPETKTWGSDKPTIGAVLFKLVFEAK